MNSTHASKSEVSSQSHSSRYECLSNSQFERSIAHYEEEIKIDLDELYLEYNKNRQVLPKKNRQKVSNVDKLRIHMERLNNYKKAVNFNHKTPFRRKREDQVPEVTDDSSFYNLTDESDPENESEEQIEENRKLERDIVNELVATGELSDSDGMVYN